MHVIGTAGHVDHGKSTLVQKLTGIDPDRFEEEKRRGLTIDLGFAWLRLPSGREIGLIDVPGHERFIRNMLAGAGGISVCLFVVAANEGWKPQSAEHLAILDLLGVESGVVALTKADTVDEETLELARAEVEEKITATSLNGAPIVACSAVTGAGLDELVAELDGVVETTPPAPDVARPRLWVDRVFTIAGAGTVVTGTLAGGAFTVGDEVQVAPEGRRARIRTIQSHKKTVERIGPGNRTALNLAGLERQGAERGDAIVKVKQWRATARVDAALRVLSPEVAGREHELTEKGAHLLYLGSAETPVRIKLLGTDRLGPGVRGYAQLYLRDALPIARGDRFVLRDVGRVVTFGGGEVLDALPALARRDDPRHLALVQRLDGSSAEDALRAIVEDEGEIGRDDAFVRTGATSHPGLVELGPRLLAHARFEELRAEVEEALSSHHRAHPLERGMPREALRAALRMEPALFDALLGRVGGIVDEGAVVRLDSHEVALAPEQKRARDELFQSIESAGFTPPLAQELGADAALLRALVDAGELVKIGDFYLTAGQAQRARDLVRARIEEAGPLTVAEIRDVLQTTRKYAVPLCEWLDSTGATRRQGDVRALGPRP